MLFILPGLSKKSEKSTLKLLDFDSCYLRSYQKLHFRHHRLHFFNHPSEMMKMIKAYLYFTPTGLPWWHCFRKCFLGKISDQTPSF